MKIRISVTFLFGLITLKSLLWVVLVPIWQTPDEQSHFAQLSYMAEKHSLKIDSQLNLSEEIYNIEKILGVFRDKSGNNKFTYHPNYNIEYTDTVFGRYENEIQTQAFGLRQKMSGTEASGYPPLYYLLSLPFYYVSYYSGIIDRLFLSRLINIFLQLALFGVAYKIGLELWNDRKRAIALGVLTMFQPMISFVAAGVHPDNLLNVLYSLGLLVCLRVVKNGLNIIRIVELAIVFILGWQTKVFMIFFLPLMFSVCTYSFFRNKKLKILIPTLALLSPIFIFLFQLPLPYVPLAKVGAITFIDYMKFRIHKMLFEVWPWYWGVFRWLSLVLPILVLRIITRVFLAIIFGFGLQILKRIKNREIDFEIKAMIFLALSSISYVVYFLLFDFKSMQANGYSVGVQGRYFLPNIVAHMSLLLFGWMGLVNFVNKFFPRVSKLVFWIFPLSMVVLNFYSLYFLSGSYYDTSSVQTFVIQAAQYKPWWAKDLLTSFIKI